MKETGTSPPGAHCNVIQFRQNMSSESLIFERLKPYLMNL